MNASISTSGRVCLCEWSGPTTITMVVSLLAHLKQVSEVGADPIVLVLHLGPSAARSIMLRSSTFMDILPAFWAYCREVVIACQGEAGILDQLRCHLCGSASTPVATPARPLSVYELLDDALTHAQAVFPHDVLELRRQRIHSGTWTRCDVAKQRC